MSRGISLHIGLNHVDTSAYPDYIIPTLAGCINDANSMQSIASAAGFTTTDRLIDGQATALNVKNKIIAASNSLANGDIFFLTYSGHGGQIPDETDQEEDGLNETWILYDRQLLDDELFAIWPQFAEGVRIFVLSDSCHSGTMVRMLLLDMMAQKKNGTRDINRSMLTMADADNLVQLANARTISANARTVRALTTVVPQKRAFPAISSLKNYLRNRTLYQNIQQLTKLSKDLDSITASLIFISGCQDNQLSGDGSVNGKFTEELLDVWNNGIFNGTYNSFYDRIIAQMPEDQTPNYMTLGINIAPFESQKPFTVISPASSGSGAGTTPATDNNGSTEVNPSVSGPASWNSNALPPTFNVNKGSNPLYYVEVATNAALFNYNANGSQRNDDTFYATWNDASINYKLFNTPQYQLPQEVWDRLKNADRLYYRVGTTMDTQWNGWKVTTSDEDYASAPFIQITSVGADNGGGGSSNGNDTSVEPSESGSRIQESVGASGVNRRGDVTIIQRLLAQLSTADGGSPSILVDGICGSGTITAIKKFQKANELNESGLFRPDRGSVILLYIKTQVITVTYNKAPEKALSYA
ncbi:MAG TPA: caspase family protein [Niastella sp.]|nr:caspase family protein [Niastella sp.]